MNTYDKWVTIFGSMSTDKTNWLEEYANLHSKNELNILSDNSEVKFPSLLPMAIKISAKTVGLDLVSVNPMSSPLTNRDPELLKAAENKTTAINRDRQINDIINDIPYEPIKIEDTEEYKEWEKSGSPSGNLFYIDYKYDINDKYHKMSGTFSIQSS